MNDNPYSPPNASNDQPGSLYRRFVPKWNLLDWSVLIVVLAILVALLLPAAHRGGPTARRVLCRSNLKQIMVALNNYHDAYGSLPPPYTVDASGQPLHSWRTLILPWIDQESLYKTIDLSKPWNDPANAIAFNTPMPAFHCASDPSDGKLTTYQAIVGSGAGFEITCIRKLTDFTDGTVNTLLVVEVDPSRAVHWMSPFDHGYEFLLTVEPKTKLIHPAGSHVALADGTVRFMSNTLDLQKRQALISIAGGESVSDW
jgi:hypothetical protein